MHPSKRSMWFVALAALIAVTAACGGQPAEEAPAAEAPAAAEPAPAPEAAPEPAPAVEEPVEPAPQMLQGNIVEIEEGTFEWLSAATREEPGRYYWVVKLRNDTTQTLDITVTFEFLDMEDGVIKTDRKTERLQPAAEMTFRVEGEMERDAARSVESYTYSWDWAIVGS